jgi:plastocyanin
LAAWLVVLAAAGGAAASVVAAADDPSYDYDYGYGSSSGSSGSGSSDSSGSSGAGESSSSTGAPAAKTSVATKASAPVGARLQLTVGPGATITLKTAAGKPVTRLIPGAYTFVVRDRSASHNARLRGAGASKASTVAGQGTATWGVTLVKGTLRFLCDPHKTFMKGSVAVS